jgi:hypothetical protein
LLRAHPLEASFPFTLLRTGHIQLYESKAGVGFVSSQVVDTQADNDDEKADETKKDGETAST